VYCVDIVREVVLGYSDTAALATLIAVLCACESMRAALLNYADLRNSYCTVKYCEV
jgi:hypothetical protein